MTTQPYTPNVPVTEIDDVQLGTDIERLNHLLRMEHDAIRGYEHAIDNVSDDKLKTRFEAYRQAHTLRGTRIANMINAMGGTPVAGGSVAGALHRNWLDLKAAIASDDAKALLEAIVFGERNLDEAYEYLLSDDNLQSPDLRETIARMHEEAHALMETTENLAQTYATT